MAEGSGTGFTAKVKIKRKSLPSSPIHVKISATPEEKMDGGTFGSSSPANAEKAEFTGMPSSQRPKIMKAGKAPRGARGGFR